MDRQRLERALVAADAAGDVEAARALAQALRSNPAQSPASPAPTDPSMYNRGDAIQKALLRGGRGAARAVGLAGRSILNTFASPPLAAADAGVAARNLMGGDYQLPSQMFNEALNTAGVPQFETPIEKGGDIASQMLIGSRFPAPGARNQAPANFNPQTMQQQALARAQQEGYRVPPSTVNPSRTNRALESIGGKIAMEQDASLRNQSVTDALVKRDLGLSDVTQMSEDVLPALRSKAAQPYKALRSVGTMRADSQYGKALDSITSQYRGAAKDFPELARTDILDAVEAVRKPSFDADSAMDAIAILRDKSSTAYRQGDKSLGKAYREISGAMESAIERSLARRGADSAKLLKEFKDARQLIAKSYTAEGALNTSTGNFNASKLAAQLAKGKPISGEMKKAAEFAQAFPKAAKLVLDSGSVRNTDVILGAGTAALSREPSYLLYPFARQAVRAGLLSDVGQRVLTSPGLQPAPKTAMGLAFGTEGLLSQ